MSIRLHVLNTEDPNNPLLPDHHLKGMTGANETELEVAKHAAAIQLQISHRDIRFHDRSKATTLWYGFSHLTCPAIETITDFVIFGLGNYDVCKFGMGDHFVGPPDYGSGCFRISKKSAKSFFQSKLEDTDKFDTRLVRLYTYCKDKLTEDPLLKFFYH